MLAAILAVLLVVASFASPAGAQSVSTATGVITGEITDTTGAMLAGVTVTVAGDALMGERAAVTPGAGTYRFVALPPGVYRLTLTRPGFAEVARDGVYVASGFTATLDVTMSPARLTHEVEVSRAATAIDRHATSIGTTFDARQLASLPGARSMGSILSAAPSVHVTRFDVGGSSLEAGSYGAYGIFGANRPMVEGLSVTGIASTGFQLDFGSFEEISVGTGAHGPEWHSAGVQMQFVSKSGGNRYRGSLYAAYENRHWQAFNVDDDQVRRGASSGGGLGPREVNRLWRFHDVDADLGGYIRRDAAWWYASFRDHETSARQVNFPVAPLRTRLTNYTGKATLRPAPGQQVVAYGQAGRNHQPYHLDPFGPAGSSTTAVNHSADSTSRYLSWGWIGKVEWNGSLGNRSFFDLRVGQFGANEARTPNGHAPRFEDVVTLAVAGGNRDWDERYRRSQLLASVSRLEEGWLGRHLFKAGGEVFLTTEAQGWREGFPGDVVHVLRDGVPVEVYLFETPAHSESALWTYSAYASDSWQPHRRLTVNLGVRFDRFRVFLPEQFHEGGRFGPAQRFPRVDVASWNVLVPRLGAAYDLTGDGRTVLKASFARFTLPPGTLLGANVNPNPAEWWRRHAWSDANGSGVWEPGEEGAIARASRGGATSESLDPSVELPAVTEAAGWVERELPARIGLRTGLVWRRGSGYFARVDANRPFDAFSVPVPIADPGPDGQAGTGDDGPAIQGFDLASLTGSRNVVGNVAGAETRHWTWEMTAQRRFAGRWSLMAGLAHVWHGDHAAGYFGQAVRQNAYPVTPNDLINAGPDGRYDFRTWTAKLHAIVDGPWGVNLAPLLRHQSGQPFGRTFVRGFNYGNVRVLAEPMGTRRMDHVTLLDLRAEKGLALPGGRRLAAFVDVYNLLNTNPEPGLNWSSGSRFLQPLSIVPPRIARLGARLDW